MPKKVSLPRRIFQFKGKENLNTQEVPQILDILYANNVAETESISNEKNTIKDQMHGIQTIRNNDQLHDTSKVTLERIVASYLNDSNPVTDAGIQKAKEKIGQEYTSFKNQLEYIVGSIYDAGHEGRQEIINEYTDLTSAKHALVNFVAKRVVFYQHRQIR